MLKKLAVGLGCLGLLLGATTMSFAGCPGCDCCKVDDPISIKIGYDVIVDLDVCLDWGNLGDDSWSTQAVIYQVGESNTAEISQAYTNDLAGIIQVGNGNEATVSQQAESNYALVFQGGNTNYASVTQTLDQATATVLQFGNGNSAIVNQ